MTKQELIKILDEKIKNAENDKIATWNCINQNKWDKQAQEHYLEKEQRLIGEIQAYTDIKNLLENEVLEDDK